MHRHELIVQIIFFKHKLVFFYFDIFDTCKNSLQDLGSHINHKKKNKELATKYNFMKYSEFLHTEMLPEASLPSS